MNIPPQTPQNPPSPLESDTGKIRVMLCDDSAIIRGLIARTLESDPEIAVVASVQNGQVALNTLARARPEIIILDIEMPEMDGMTALPALLERNPNLKIIMCSTLTEKGARITMEALQMGAVECIAKPTSTRIAGSNSDFQRQLLSLVKGLGRSSHTNRIVSRPHSSASAPLNAPSPPSHAQASKPSYPTTHSTPHARSATAGHGGTNAQTSKQNIFSLYDDRNAWKGKPDILAIGSSTGGPQALFQVMKHCTGFQIPIVITQHMPATFTKILAQHIEQQSHVPTHEGENGMVLENGHAYVAPGGFHMVFEKSGTQTKIRLTEDPPENFCRPSVDPMLRSAIALHGKKVLAIILTGMGQDGLKGCLDLVKNGGRVAAQDEPTSVVWGMPGAVAMAGICSEVLPLHEIGTWIRRNVLQ